jgi:hypothetical protein
VRLSIRIHEVRAHPGVGGQARASEALVGRRLDGRADVLDGLYHAPYISDGQLRGCVRLVSLVG